MLMSYPEFIRQFTEFKNSETICISKISMESNRAIDKPLRVDIDILLEQHTLKFATTLTDTSTNQKSTIYHDVEVDVRLSYLEGMWDVDLAHFTNEVTKEILNKKNCDYIMNNGGEVSVESITEILMEIYKPGPIPTDIDYFYHKLDNTELDPNYQLMAEYEETDRFLVSLYNCKNKNYSAFKTPELAWEQEGYKTDYGQVLPDNMTPKEFFLSTLFSFTPRQILAAATIQFAFPFELQLVYIKRILTPVVQNDS